MRATDVPAPVIPDQLTLTVNGMRFSALAMGAPTGELVLCLHGFPEFADAWIPIMRRIAAAGYRVVAVDQRGYSPGARPPHVYDYAIHHLTSDVLGFAQALGRSEFHLVGHDWGGIVAWTMGVQHADQLRSLCVLSTPHPDALRKALKRNWDQKRRSWYVALFRLPSPITERLLMAFGARPLRDAYKRKVPRAQVDSNIKRLREPGALTAALNWYRALKISGRTGIVTAPTLFVWGSNDQALGRMAAMETAHYVRGTYRFEELTGASHWLLEETADAVSELVIAHVRRNGM